MKKFRRYIGKFDTLVRRRKISHGRTYRGQIKLTKGLQHLNDPKTKPLSHRIVRAKTKQETQKEINDL